MVNFYNSEIDRCNSLIEKNPVNLASKSRQTFINNIKSNDSTKISWSDGLVKKLLKGEKINLDGSQYIEMHRPFIKNKSPSAIFQPKLTTILSTESRQSNGLWSSMLSLPIRQAVLSMIQILTQVESIFSTCYFQLFRFLSKRKS